MYLKHFGFNEFPFSLTPNLRFFCNLLPYKEALNVIMVSLYNGEGFIKITGEVGIGKTMLCRKLLNTLGDEYVTAYVSNANLDIFNLQKAIAHELEIPVPDGIENYKLINLLNDKLIGMHKLGKKVVVIVDEAHALSDRSLEGLRLLSNLETETSKLMQIVLVGQPELDRRLKKSHLRQLSHRIVFSYRLPTMSRKKELVSYICSRLSSAGYNDAYDSLFSKQAMRLLLESSRGIPRLINVLCHKALLITYGQGREKIEADTVRIAISDTDSITKVVPLYSRLFKASLVLLVLMLVVGVGSYFVFRMMAYIL